MNRIRLDAIVFDAGTQIRAALDQQLVSDYAEAMTDGATFPPIVLYHDGNRYYLADGFHRYMAARRNDWVDIDADVHAGTKDDALWFALGANKANGKRLSEADKKHAILLALRAWPERSASQISKQVGCTHVYVMTIKNQVVTSYNLPERVIGKDGKSYPSIRTPKIESEPQVAPRGKEAARVADYEARKAAGVEGLSPGVLKRLPRKSDAEIVDNSVNALRGVIGAFEMVDPAPLSNDPRAEEWRSVVADTIAVLRSFNKRLERKAV